MNFRLLADFTEISTHIKTESEESIDNYIQTELRMLFEALKKWEQRALEPPDDPIFPRK